MTQNDLLCAVSRRPSLSIASSVSSGGCQLRGAVRDWACPHSFNPLESTGNITCERQDGDNYWTLSPDPNRRVVT